MKMIIESVEIGRCQIDGIDMALFAGGEVVFCEDCATWTGDTCVIVSQSADRYGSHRPTWLPKGRTVNLDIDDDIESIEVVQSCWVKDVRKAFEQHVSPDERLATSPLAEEVDMDDEDTPLFV